jgi:hypothetical protein
LPPATPARLREELFARARQSEKSVHDHVRDADHLSRGFSRSHGDVPASTVIESTQPVIVEHSLYTNANGVIWAAGTDATGTRLP